MGCLWFVVGLGLLFCVGVCGLDRRFGYSIIVIVTVLVYCYYYGIVMGCCDRCLVGVQFI